MDVTSPYALLGQFLSETAATIERRAARGLARALDERMPRGDRRQSVAGTVGELARRLSERGEDAPRLWGEAVRAHGRLQFEARRGVGDLMRQFGLLESAIGFEWAKRRGVMPPAVQAALADCIHEGEAAAATEFAKLVRLHEVTFRESALVETIVANLDEGIALVEADGVVSFATPLALELLGRRASDLLGRRIDGLEAESFWNELEARAVSGEPLTVNQLPIRTALAVGRVPEPLLVWIGRGDRARALEMNAVPIWHGGTPGESRSDLRGAIFTLQDRTGELRHAEELETAERQLTTLRTRMLQRTRAQALGELARGAAHALNNLLNPMQLRLRRLRAAPALEDFDALEAGLADMARLVSRFQELGVAPRGSAPEPTDLDRIVSEAMALVRPEAGRLRVESSLGEAGQVWASPGELRERLVMMLLQLREDLAAGETLRIETRAEEEGAVCILSFQGGAPGAGGELPSGFALTLDSAKSSVERWGGVLEYETAAGGWTRVAYRLQRARRPAEEVPMEPMKTPYDTRRVLVVDDDADNAEMLAEVLRDEGYEVETAATGREAITAWHDKPFTIGLVDLLLPDIEGTEVARVMRAERPETRVALVTGWELDARQREAAPVQRVFRKPIELAQLLAFIEGVAQEEAPAPM